MKDNKMNTSEFVKKVQSQEIDIVSHTQKALARLKEINKEYFYLNEIAEENAMQQAEKLAKNPKGKLAGIVVSLKDAICAKGIQTRGGSRILTGYKPVMNATVTQKIINEGGIIIGKTIQDEFGFGGFSVNVGKDMDVPLNPFDKERSCGGSSGGAAGLTQKMDLPHIAIGESTGGSIVAPGSFCGVNALCPTYGRVSRYGLLDYGNSLDKIGPMGQTAHDVARMMSVISGHDPKDSTSLKEDSEDYSSYLSKDIKGLKIGVIKECFSEDADQEVRDACMDKVKMLESNGATYEEVSMPLTKKYGIAAYYMIATSEASTNLAKYCGMRYGKHEALKGAFNEYFTNVRSKHFGDEAKRRIILGTFARMSGFRDAYYIKAAKVRTKIIEEYKQHFKKFDILVSPSAPFISPKFSEIKDMTPLQHYMADVMTVGPNFAGMPHMNVNCSMSKDKMPIGMMLIGNHLKEGKVLQIAKEFESQ